MQHESWSAPWRDPLRLEQHETRRSFLIGESEGNQLADPSGQSNSKGESSSILSKPRGLVVLDETGEMLGLGLAVVGVEHGDSPKDPFFSSDFRLLKLIVGVGDSSCREWLDIRGGVGESENRDCKTRGKLKRHSCNLLT